MEEQNLILAVDVGTTDTKAVLVSPDGFLDSRQASCELLYPDHSCVEQSPEDLAGAVYGTCGGLMASHPDLKKRLAGMVFTSQMQNTIPVDTAGKPIMNMLSWMDERAARFTQDVMFKGLIKIEGYPIMKLLKIMRITGGLPGKNGKDTLCKLAWMKRNRADLYDRAHRFLDVKDYAIFLATGNYVTSYDMAWITWLMDTRNRDQEKWTWSGAVHSMFGLDPRKMPELKPSTAVAGKVTREFSAKTGVPEGLPVVNGSGDMLTAAIGSGAIEPGRMHVNIGTAGWIATHHPCMAVNTAHYIGTIASGIPGVYLIISKQETSGAALDWLKGILYPGGLAKDMASGEVYADMDRMAAQSPPGANGVIVTPWLYGERSPVNNPCLRGQIFNIELDTSRADLCRAAMEGVAFNIRWGMRYVEQLSRRKSRPATDEVRLIGGGSKSAVWCRIFADVLQKPVVRMMNPQMACAQGAAAIAMVSLGIYRGFGDIERMLQKGERFDPDPAARRIYDAIFNHFLALYKNNVKEFNRINR